VPPSEQETADLEVLHTKVKDRKIQCFDYCARLLRMPQNQLKHVGYATREEAVFGAVQRAQREIEKLTVTHIWKYPG
jgi:hypothetical protein